MRKFLFPVLRPGILCISLLLFSAIGGAVACADPLPEIEVPVVQKKRIAFVPHVIPIYLHKDIAFKANYDVLHLKRALIAHAENNPYLTVLDVDDVLDAYKNAPMEEIDAGTQAAADMGFAHNFMANMNYDSAIVMLRRIVENYEKASLQFTNPHEVAQAWQLLAYAYIARYQEASAESEQVVADPLHPARLAFVELIRLAPYLTMLEGRQSADRVMLYDQALELFLGNSAYRYTTLRVASLFAHKLSADILVFARIVQERSEKLFLEFDIFSAETQTFEHRRIPLRHAENSEELAEGFIDDATRELDAYYACLQIRPLARDVPKYSVAVGMLYHAFINYSTQRSPNSFGAAFSFVYDFHPNFFIRTGFEFSLVNRDKARTLYNSFEIYRLPILVGAAYQWDFFRPYFALGIDFSFASSYTIVHSNACKTFGLDDRECTADNVDKYREIFAFDIAFLAGFAFVFNKFFLRIEFFADVTVYPFDDVFFKYPIGGQFGVGYRF